MSFLHLKFSAPATADFAAGVAGALLDLSAQVLHKQTAYSAVGLGYVDPMQLFIGGESLAK
ncbi:hypothetical protein [Hymenobacter bucti]|uniref:Uncharacterized protein n=1 Tax=Hymenobacter bucti TaxID=1844114 RepID=A0ABW4R0P8_9BACT